MGTIEWMQSWQGPFLTGVFRVITALGNEEFYLFLLPVLYWTWNKRAMRRLVVLFLPALLLGVYLKYALHVPRPAGPHLVATTGASFPSGHALGATVVWGYLALAVRRRWFWVAATALVLLIGLSRIALGVHWPSDIAGGIAIGALLLIFFHRIEERASAFCRRQKPAVLAGLLVVAATVICVLFPVAESFVVMGLFVGMGTGMIVERRRIRFRVAGSLATCVGRIFVGSVGTFACWKGLSLLLPPGKLTSMVSYACTGFWMMGLAPFLFTHLRLSVDEGPQPCACGES